MPNRGLIIRIKSQIGQQLLLSVDALATEIGLDEG